MVKVFDVKEDNQIVVIGIIIFLVLSIILYVVYPGLKTATGIYGFLCLIALGIYTNPAFQDYLYGIEKSLKTFLWIGAGIGIGLAYIILTRLVPGLSMGLPLVPQSVDSSLRWVIICVFAPFIEDVLRFSILGLVLYIRRKDGISKGELWLAIILQAVFFMCLHAFAYSGNWYQAPSWIGAITIISSVQGALFAAFLFAMLTGWFVSRDGVKNLTISIIAHFIVNFILFVNIAVVGLNIVG